MAEFICYSPETITALLVGYIPIYIYLKKFKHKAKFKIPPPHLGI